MQGALYRQEKRRFASDHLYIINAVKDPDDKPIGTAIDWPTVLQEKHGALRGKLSHFRPKVVLTFGAFAYECVRRACGEELLFPFGYWSTKRLGEEFKKRLALFESARVNVLPLLHVSISRGRCLKIIKSHSYFVGEEGKGPANYFEFVGTGLAQLFLAKCKHLPIWVSGTGGDQTR
jgi:hypothetical protein